MLRGDHVKVLDGFPPLCHIQHLDLSQTGQDPDDPWGGRLANIVGSTNLDLADSVVCPTVRGQKVDHGLLVELVMDIVELDPCKVSKSAEPVRARP